MGSYSWNTGTSGSWTSVADWNSGTIPGGLDTATLDGAVSGSPQTISGVGSAATLYVTGLNDLTGTVTAGYGLIDLAGNPALLDILSGGSLALTAGGTIGGSGQGTLSIESGAQASIGNTSGSMELVLGYNAGASGTLNLLGTLNLTGPSQVSGPSVAVGYSGTGALIVNGGVLNGGTTQEMGVAGATGSIGSVLVENGGSVHVGTTLSSSQAALSVGGKGNGTVTVDNSTLTASGSAYFGRAGTGTLVVQNHGLMTVGDTLNGMSIGAGSSSSYSASNVGGSGYGTVTSYGTLHSVLGITLGGYGVTGSLTVNNNGQVKIDKGLTIGAGAIVGSTTIGGTGTLSIGANGTLLANAGNFANVSDIVAGNYQSGTVSTTGNIVVTGAGALLNAGTGNGGAALVIGSSGIGSLTVSAGASLVAVEATSTLGALVLGNFSGAVGTVLIDNANANVTGWVAVGGAGTGALTVQNSGVLTDSNYTGSAQGLLVGISGGGQGSVTISNATANFSAGTVAIGDGGTGLLTMLGGGTLDAANMWVGGTISGANGTATLSGSGNLLQIGGTLTVGGNGQGTLLAGSGVINAASVVIGSGSTLLVSNNEQVNATGGFNVASNGTLGGAGTLAGAVSNNGTIGVTGGTLTITGSVSGSGGIIIGSGGNELVLQAGASENVGFSDATGTLALSAPISGTITGFVAGDVLAVGNAVASVSYASNTLSLLNAGGTLLGTLNVQTGIGAGTFSVSGGNVTVSSATSSGTTYAWTGAASTDLGTAGNWSPNGTPGTLDTIQFGSAATLTGSVTAGQAQFGNSGAIVANNATFTVGGLAFPPYGYVSEEFVGNGFTLNGGSIAGGTGFAVFSGSTGNNVTISGGASVVTDGDVFGNVTGSTVAVGGTLTVTGPGTRWTAQHVGSLDVVAGGNTIITGFTNLGLSAGGSGAGWGALIVSNQATYTTQTSASLANSNGSSGSASVLSGALWSIGGNLGVGQNGTGLLSVDDAIINVGTNLDVGSSNGAYGSIGLTDGGTITLTGNTGIGESGTGSLVITAGTAGGGVFDTGWLDIASNGGGGYAGVVSLSGTGSAINATSGVNLGSGPGNSATGTLSIGSGAVLNTPSVNLGYGSNVLLSGGTIAGAVVVNSTSLVSLTGYGVITGALSGGGGAATTITASGGTLSVGGSVGMQATLGIANGADLSLGGSVISNQQIRFAGTGGTLALGAIGSFAGTIDNLGHGDSIVVNGASRVTQNVNFGVTTLQVYDASSTLLGTLAIGSTGYTGNGFSVNSGTISYTGGNLFNWTNAGGGAWTGGNWSDSTPGGPSGAPGTLDVANLGNSAAGTITGSGSAGQINFGNTVALTLSGGSIGVAGITQNFGGSGAVGVAVPSGLNINSSGALVFSGETLNANGNLNVTSSAAITAQNGAAITTLGDFIGNFGSTTTYATLTVTGIGTSWNDAVNAAYNNGGIVNTGNTELGDGTAGLGVTGSLVVSNGASMTTGNIATFGFNTNNQGFAQVTGGAVWTISNQIDIGQSGTGALTITSGTVTGMSSGAELGNNVGGSGALTISGSAGNLGVMNVGGNLVDGNSGFGSISVNAYGSLGLTGAAGSNYLFIGNNNGGGSGSLAVTGGGVTLGGALEIGNNANGAVTVSSNGSIGAGSVIVGVGGAGNLGITGGTVTATGSVAIGTGAGAGSVTLSGGVLQASTINVGTAGSLTGYGTLAGTVFDQNWIIANGSLLITGSVSGAGTLQLGSNSTLDAASGLGGGHVSFGGPNGDLIVGGTLAPGDTLDGYVAGDSIDLTGIAYAVGNSETFNPGSDQLTLNANGNQYVLQFSRSFTGQPFMASNDGAGGTMLTVACFAGATHIATPAGETTMEALAVGDLVMTEEGEARAVIWIGRRSVNCLAHPAPEEVWPVRIRAGAFAPGLPKRDLLVSPEHALFVDGFLMPARCLLNGATVVQERVDQITWWHLELASHDLVLAEGLPTETYLDTGNRSAFENGGASLQLHPRFGRQVHEALACAPFADHGKPVAWARERLVARATALGYVRAQGSWQLLADGVALAADADGTFALPETARVLVLASEFWRPMDVEPGSDDVRRLGACLATLAVDGMPVALDHPALGGGFHAMESGVDGTTWRWTDGAARLDLAAFDVPPRQLHLTISCLPSLWAAGEDVRAA